MTEIFSNRPERIFPDDEFHRSESKLKRRNKPMEVSVEWWEDEYHEGLGIRGSGKGRERYPPPQTGCQ